MPFAADTKIRVAIAVGLPLTPSGHQTTSVDFLAEIQTILTAIETAAGDTAVTLIEGYLTDLEAAQTSLKTGASSAGLIQADVLRWESGGQRFGYEKEIERLKALIISTLDLNRLLDIYNEAGGGTNKNRVRIMRG